MGQEFVSEPIEPEAGSFSPELMTQGLAALPAAFRWRGRRHVIAECLEHRKVSAREGHAPGGERYLRRQEFVVRLDSGQTAVVYVTRQPVGGRRWFLFTISPASDPPGTSGAVGTEG